MLKRIFKILKDSVTDFLNDDAMSLAGALAFYTALSFAPLLIILLSVCGLLGEGTQEQVVRQFERLIGPEAGKAIHLVIDASKEEPQYNSLAGWLGIGILLFSATTVFAQLQSSMNVIWNVTIKPGQGAWGWVRKRILSFGMVVAIGFLLLVSLSVNTGLSLVLTGESGLWQLANSLISFGVFVFLFAAIFKFLPDVNIAWKEVWIGATLTAMFFTVGKYFIGIYLGRSAVASSYGAAGSLLVFLLWVYYSAVILFFGAELTQVIARDTKAAIEPNEHAIWRDDDHKTKGQKAEKKAELKEGENNPAT
ncbi:N/A [soil metagenome]